MTRQTFFPNPDSKPQGFSPATRAGDFIFVSGQISLDNNGQLVGQGDCEAQSRQCFRNIEAALNAAGASMVDVAKITAFIVNPQDYAAYASVRLDLFPEDGPASSSVFVKGLVSSDFLVEVEAIAFVG